jgi:hypothetical protein
MEKKSIIRYKVVKLIQQIVKKLQIVLMEILN